VGQSFACKLGLLHPSTLAHLSDVIRNFEKRYLNDQLNLVEDWGEKERVGLSFASKLARVAS
jgi:hypothetical protein